MPEEGAASEFADTVASTPPVPDSSVPDFTVASADEPHDTQNEPTLSHIGRYALKRPLGAGGLGTVYEAWDPLLSRTVAVKTLQFDVDTPQRVSLDGLFLNEARAVAGLNHPHIITVHDAGLSAHGVYIAMERLRGRDLRQALALGWRPSALVAAHLGRRVADALAYAHGRGVIHCDIKPANIFLSGKGRPTVLDFGIARIAHGSAVPALEGLVAGSPHYLAPEQLQGQPFDDRADVYSLGVVMYEMLAGRKAFDGGSLEQITNAVMHLHPAPAHEVQPAVPAALSAIVDRAMSRDPAERFQTAADMASALRAWSETAAATAELEPLLPKWRRVLPWAGAAVALVAAAALIAGYRGDPPPSPPLVADVPALVVPADTATPAFAVVPATDSALPFAASAAAITAPPTNAAPTRRRPDAAARPAIAAKPSPSVDTPAKPTVSVAARGAVQLAVTPWGQIEVDGRAAGLTPPLSRLDLSEGPHQITVRNGENPPFTTTVQVSADKPVVVRHRFGP